MPEHAGTRLRREQRHLQQERFCQEMFGGATKAEAHERAGYLSPKGNRIKTAYRLSNTKWCQERMIELRGKALEDSGMDREWVLSNAKDLYEKATTAKPVKDSRGNSTGVYRMDGSTAVKILNMVGLQVGLFNPEKKTRHGQLDPLDKMNEKQLIKFIGATLKDLGPGALKELGLVAAKSESVGDGEASSELTDSPASPLQTLQ